MYEALIALVLGFVTSFVIMPVIIQKMRRKRVVGVDVHKKERPVVPEMGGIATIIGLTVSIVASSILLAPEKTDLLVSFLATTLIAGIVGAIDDIKPLNAKVKPFLTLFASTPILLLQTYNLYGPFFPIIGRTRLTMVYPFMIPIAIAITSNSVNMMDPFNGTMSGACSIVTSVLLVSALLLGRNDAIILCASLLGPLLAFHYFNRYPSKVFSGDIGSLSIGSAIGAIAILGQLEVVAIVAFMPQIMNAFYGLTTIGRLYERREIPRPVSILDDGRLMATADPNAPITLARLVLARGPLYEREAIRVFTVLSLISGLLAILTAYLIVVTP